jgi:hypothetical protein
MELLITGVIGAQVGQAVSPVHLQTMSTGETACRTLALAIE